MSFVANTQFFGALFFLGGVYRINLSIRFTLITNALQKVTLVKSDKKMSVKSHHFSYYNSSNLYVVFNRNYNQALTKTHQSHFCEIFDGIQPLGDAKMEFKRSYVLRWV